MIRINRDNGIVWTDATINAWRGCVKVSEGCKHCWSERIMERFGHAEAFTVANAEQLHTYVEEPADAIDPLGRLDPQ